MSRVTGYLPPDKEMDEISRRLRAGERALAEPFGKSVRPAEVCSAREEMDPAAISIRLQAEGLDVRAAQEQADNAMFTRRYGSGVVPINNDCE